MNFRYGKKEMEYLKSRDRRLGEVIDQIGRIRWTVEPDLFSAIVQDINFRQGGRVDSRKSWRTAWGDYSEGRCKNQYTGLPQLRRFAAQGRIHQGLRRQGRVGQTRP